MNDTKHTPGPWHVDPITAHVNESSTGLPLCAMQWPSEERSEETTKANARLIAASPDLLEALQLAVHVRGTSDDTPEVLNQMQAAIDKATGEKP